MNEPNNTTNVNKLAYWLLKLHTIWLAATAPSCTPTTNHTHSLSLSDHHRPRNGGGRAQIPSGMFLLWFVWCFYRGWRFIRPCGTIETILWTVLQKTNATTAENCQISICKETTFNTIGGNTGGTEGDQVGGWFESRSLFYDFSVSGFCVFFVLFLSQ